MSLLNNQRNFECLPITSKSLRYHKNPLIDKKKILPKISREARTFIFKADMCCWLEIKNCICLLFVGKSVNVELSKTPAYFIRVHPRARDTQTDHVEVEYFAHRVHRIQTQIDARARMAFCRKYTVALSPCF